ncbi:MAG: MFS transporter [Acidobacteriia bacterium]|nr:MFS transporter [Terriglobia bacterium]
MAQNSEHLSRLNESDWQYYGWRVVLAASVGVMVGFGSLFVFTFGVFVKPLEIEFGWSREAISRGFGFAALMLAICSPTLGRWLDRYGPRRVILPCMMVFGCGIASLALLRAYLWQFYATCILLGAVGNGAAHLSYSRAISTWFHRRLGMALALVMAGAGLGSMLLPFLAETIIASSGWRAAYLVLGGLALGLGLPSTWRYIHERRQLQHDFRPAPHAGLTWQQGLRSFPFWIIVAVLFVGSVSMNGSLTHLVPLLTDRGITGRDAALCASALGGSSLVARVIVGSLLDRFLGSRVAFAVYLILAAGILLLGRAHSLFTGCLAAAFIGVGAGGEADITPYLLTRYFGLRAFSTLYGVTWSFYAVAGAMGPVILGRAYDSTGSYTSLLTVLALCTTLAAALMFLLPRYSNSEAMEAEFVQLA